MAESRPASRNLAAMGFLAMSYVIVGLIGGFATFAAPLTLERAMAREAALDAALATKGEPAALAALAARLGDSAPALRGADAAALPGKVAAERLAMRERFRAEAADAVFRLRIVIALITVSAAAFGLALVGALGRPGSSSPG